MAMAFPRIGSILRRRATAQVGAREKNLARKASIARAALETLESRQLLTTTLTVDLRLAAGQTALVNQVGQVVNMELWATVTGSDNTGTNDGVAWIGGSFLSSGSAILGNLAATPVSPFNPVGVPGAQRGTQQDLDGDGDLDVGTNSTSDANSGELFLATGAGMNPVYGEDTTGPQQFKLATLTFTVTKLSSSGQVDIVFRMASSSFAAPLGAEWVVDGVPANNKASSADIGLGSSVHLTSPDTAPPTASLTSVNNLTTGGGKSYTLNVLYKDDTNVKWSSIGPGDIVVTGPRGTYNATVGAATTPADAPTNVVGYTILAKDGYWNCLDNGTYTVTLKANQVSDTLGHFIATDTKLGTFQVNVPRAVVVAGTGMLAVTGTGANDAIYVIKSGTLIRAQVDGVYQLFSSTAVKSIKIWGLAGDDVVSVGPGIIGAWIEGGPGNDSVFGGDGNDTLYGGDGNDILVGNKGNDAINGGAGRDILIGGSGIDTLDASLGQDILIGGTTLYDANTLALTLILREWGSTHTYVQRVLNVRSGTGSSGRLNGIYYFQSGKTVFADAYADVLTGGAGQSWFFYKKFAPSADVIKGLMTSEYADLLTVVK